MSPLHGNLCGNTLAKATDRQMRNALTQQLLGKGLKEKQAVVELQMNFLFVSIYLVVPD